MSDKKDCGIVVSKSWPSLDRGYGIAVTSSLNQYTSILSKILFIALTNDPLPRKVEASYNNVIWKQIKIIKEEKWKRFLKSISVSCPASIIQYNSLEIKRKLLWYLSNCVSNFDKVIVIFEDIPPAYQLPGLKKRFIDATFVLRSHNIISEVFEGFEKDGWISKRLAWILELNKLRKFEKKVLRVTDKTWTISYRDSQEYQARFNKTCDGVFGVCINVDRYKNLPQGDVFTVLYIGSADLRKGHGIVKFINNTWESLLEESNNARLILAGRDTSKFQSSRLSIDGRGYVEDDREILRKGMIFINPQERGSGIKLKSIIAMLSGKVLISTTKGLEGIEGQNGKHFFKVRDIHEMKDIILYLMRHENEAFQVGKQAQELAISMNNQMSFAQHIKPLLNEIY